MYKKTQSLYISLGFYFFIFAESARFPPCFNWLLYQSARGPCTRVCQSPCDHHTPTQPQRDRQNLDTAPLYLYVVGNRLGIHCETSLLYSKNPGGSESPQSFSESLSVRYWMLLFMSSGLILILREKGAKHYSTSEGGGVYLCMAGARSQSAAFLFFTKAILITGDSIWKVDPSLVSLPSFVCSFDHSEKWFVRWDKHSGSKPQPALIKGNC